MKNMISDLLLVLIFVSCFYVGFSNFGVRGWRKDGKLWWKK